MGVENNDSKNIKKPNEKILKIIKINQKGILSNIDYHNNNKMLNSKKTKWCFTKSKISLVLISIKLYYIKSN